MDGKKLEYKGEAALKEIERLTSKPDEIQGEILKEILKTNCETEYLSKFIKKGTKDDIVSQFKKCVPVISYKDIQPYIQRIENGQDSSLLTGHTITEMLCRSFLSFLLFLSYMLLVYMCVCIYIYIYELIMKLWHIFAVLGHQPESLSWYRRSPKISSVEPFFTISFCQSSTS